MSETKQGRAVQALNDRCVSLMEKVARLTAERDDARQAYDALSLRAGSVEHTRAALDAEREKVRTLRVALRDLIDAIPDATVAADPPLGCWIEAGMDALGLTGEEPRFVKPATVPVPFRKVAKS
jgi:hypothetical protein